MGRWADKVFQKIVEREGESHDKIQKEVLDRQRVLASAPDLWRDLASGILGEAGDLNSKRPGLAKITNNSDSTSASLSVAVGPRKLALAFKKDIPKITYTVTESQGPRLDPLKIVDREFAIRVVNDDVWLWGMDGDITIHDAVQVMLGFLAP